MSKTGSTAGSTSRFVAGEIRKKKDWKTWLPWVLLAAMALAGGSGFAWLCQRTERLEQADHRSDSLVLDANRKLFSLRKSLSAVIPDPRGDMLLRLHGSNTIGDELGPDLARAWLSELGGQAVAERRDSAHAPTLRLEANFPGEPHPQVVEVEAKGSGTAFDHLKDRSCDIGMSSRPIKDEELEGLESAGILDMAPPASEHVIGMDAIAVVVHPGNPLSTLDLQTLSEIFSGTLTDWSQVPGAMQGPIHVINRDARSGTRSWFQEVVLHGAPFAKDAREFASHAEVIQAVRQDPSAIAFVSLPFASKAKALALRDGSGPPVYPGAFAVRSEDYPLSRRLYLYWPARSSHLLAREFIEFCLGTKGQELVSRDGFLPLKIDISAEKVAGAERLPADLAALLQRDERLSCTFRFTASGRLDSRGQRDLGRLRQILSEGRLAARVHLVGFCDSTGNPEADMARSRELAERLAQEPTLRMGIPVEALGGGPWRPLASNATPAGRERNRRVEVWIQPR